MKKTTLLLSMMVCFAFANAQTNLLVNPSFEEWADNKPTGWTIPVSAGHAGAITITQETTIVNDGTYSFKVVTDGTQNPAYQQIVPVTGGKTYTIIINYRVEAGDNTDARIWCNFMKGNVYYKENEVDAALWAAMKGPGGGSNDYFTGEMGVWHTYTADVTAPADATNFAFEFRTYKNSTVYWDNMYFGEKSGSGMNNPALASPSFHVSGSELLVKNIENGTVVEFYNAAGAKVQSAVFDGNAIGMSSLSKGIYIVRAGTYSQKVIF